MRRSLALICIALFTLFHLQPTTAFAQTFNLTNGVGSWTVNGNWSTGTFPNSVGASANFNGVTGVAGLSVSLSSGVTIGNLSIHNDNSIVENSIPALFRLNQEPGGLLTFDQTADANAQLTVNGASTNLNNVTISTLIQLNDSLSVNVNNTAVSSAALLSGVISGNGGLLKNGNGGLTLSGSNIYSGGTTVSAGTLTLGHASNTLSNIGSVTVSGGTLALGANSDTVGAVTISSGSITSSIGVLTGSSYSLTGSGTISAILGGSGALTKSGSGTVTLSGVNTYNGGTTVSDGTLELGHASNTLADGGAVTVSGGTLAIGSNSDTIGALTLSSGSITGSSGVLTASSYSLTNTGSISAILGGTGALTKTGAGTATLSGVNTYTGGANINEGVLSISNAAALGSSGTISFGGGTLQYNGITTDLSSRFSNAAGQAVRVDTAGNNVTLASNLASSGGSLTKSGLGSLTLSGSNTYSGGTTVSGGTLIGTTSSLQGNITNNSLVKFEQSTSGTYSGNMSGTGSLTKAGSGSVTVSGTNNYAGGTTVEAGKLVVASAGSVSHSTSNFLVKQFGIAEVNGAVTAKMLTVESGGTLSGSGTITAETVTVSGQLNPGNSAGTITMLGSLVLQSDAELNFELNETDRTVGSGVNDLIIVNGDLTLDGTLNVPGGPWNTSGTFAAPFTWRLFQFSGVLTNNGLALGAVPDLTGTPAIQSWQIEVVNLGGGGGYVNLNAVPEPSVAFLLGTVLAGTLTLRRNRRNA